MISNKDFILSPITGILSDVATASAGIGDGIETFPLCDYVMQSVFLKMTGFQEQKMKCLCWEMATWDYDYRYEFSKNRLGECSTYDEKQTIYKDLIEQIEKHIPRFNVSTGINRANILSDTGSDVTDIFNNTNLSIWAQQRFIDFGSIWSRIEVKHFARDSNNLLFEKENISLQRIYKNHLYKHRNRVAHNAQSYQQNLPTLSALVKEDYKYENYFIWFAILVLIDKVFMDLYRKHLDVFQDY
jgi:hypothetical protein